MSAKLQSKRSCILNMDGRKNFMDIVCSKRKDKETKLCIRKRYTYSDKGIYNEQCTSEYPFLF